MRIGCASWRHQNQKYFQNFSHHPNFISPIPPYPYTLTHSLITQTVSLSASFSSVPILSMAMAMAMALRRLSSSIEKPIKTLYNGGGSLYYMVLSHLLKKLLHLFLMIQFIMVYCFSILTFVSFFQSSLSSEAVYEKEKCRVSVSV